ncbi:hypothetical protein HLRTI_002723 [Halorhabdus tiamatea SARL4B]|uniref:Archaeal Type IV pilin N-terminal domain-containing protein n=1 Tax=Halorhabdus tiamatea SARL4B TaxID=1033806 RepID=F7PNM4_9EURY|nr:type IV pilin [Halorhabdus tiamatea]ERJ05281.1 hypothetical protein HLRTI_002723 [Halorhabdus tiamatea SARL4B]CCQ33740.1 conserved hypothetical protein (DUF1628) [Halorhabdus tiamatea SARL4B]
MDERGVSPAVGVVVMVALTVVLAATVGTMVLGSAPPDRGTVVRLSASADAGTDRVSVTHEGGGSIDIGALDVTIAVDGKSLDHQPPVPFFAATGFASGPTGPFNSRTAGDWTAGETATLELASTNDPLIANGETVTVTVTEGDDVLARIETTAT